MVTRAEALAIAKEELAKWKFNREGDELILLENKLKETPYAWVITWTSKRWYETKELVYLLAGAGPFIISKQTGHITQYSSAYGTKSALEKYEEEQQLYGLRITADLTDMCIKLLLKKLLPISNQELLRIAKEPNVYVMRGARERLKNIHKEWLSQGLATEVFPWF